MTNNDNAIDITAAAVLNLESIMPLLELQLDEEMTFPEGASLAQRVEIQRLTELLIARALLNDCLPVIPKVPATDA